MTAAATSIQHLFQLRPLTLRVTQLYRCEDGAWKIIHRHADPIEYSIRLTRSASSGGTDSTRLFALSTSRSRLRTRRAVS
jgi:hypothetical protein